MKNLKCPECGGPLKLSQGYTGRDWSCKAGEGSGFNVEIHLECDNGHLYHIGNVRDLGDFSETIDK